ncbi:hypothetical protein BF95_04865 [Sphingobium sp. Ant17]|nr:hypothetical protein BF95_04865 [Sphingobium sp. Ant17]
MVQFLSLHRRCALSLQLGFQLQYPVRPLADVALVLGHKILPFSSRMPPARAAQRAARAYRWGEMAMCFGASTPPSGHWSQPASTYRPGELTLAPQRPMQGHPIGHLRTLWQS